MYHKKICSFKKAALYKKRTESIPSSVLFSLVGVVEKLSLFLGVFALLICNTARSLASALAGSLALTAAALCIAQITGLDSLDMFHNKIPPQYILTKF